MEMTATQRKPRRKPRVNPDTIRTHWTFSLHYGHPSNPRRSGMSGGSETLPEAIAEAFRNVTYYIGLGYVVSVEFERQCTKCGGCGKVTAGRMKLKACPDCKGLGTFDRIAESRWTEADPVTITNSLA